MKERRSSRIDWRLCKVRKWIVSIGGSGMVLFGGRNRSRRRKKEKNRDRSKTAYLGGMKPRGFTNEHAECGASARAV